VRSSLLLSATRLQYIPHDGSQCILVVLSSAILLILTAHTEIVASTSATYPIPTVSLLRLFLMDFTTALEAHLPILGLLDHDAEIGFQQLNLSGLVLGSKVYLDMAVLRLVLDMLMIAS